MFFTTRIYYLLFLLFVIAFSTNAQNIIIKKDNFNRPLTWEDFDGKVDERNPFMAQTNYEMKYSMTATQGNGDTVICNFKVTLLLANDSWVKKDKKTDRLLQHEQRHFDIGVLFAREMDSTFRNTTFFMKDYKTKPNAIYHDIMQRCRDMQQQYDKETDHSLNTEEQKKWEDRIQMELDKG